MMDIVQESLAYLAGAEVSYILLAIALTLLSMVFWAFRWKTVITAMGYHARTLSLVPMVMGGIFFNNVTPSSKFGGEPVRIYWAKRALYMPFRKGVLAAIYERGMEAVPLSFLALYTSLVMDDYFFGPDFGRDVLIVLAIAAASLFILRRHPGIFRSFLDSRLFRDRFTLSVAVSVSCLVWALHFLRFKLIFMALGAALPVSFILAITFFSFVLGSLPLTPGGVGVVEVGLVSVMAALGVGMPLAVGVVTIERLISYVLVTAAGGMCVVSLGGMEAWRRLKSA